MLQQNADRVLESAESGTIERSPAELAVGGVDQVGVGLKEPDEVGRGPVAASLVDLLFWTILLRLRQRAWQC